MMDDYCDGDGAYFTRPQPRLDALKGALREVRAKEDRARAPKTVSALGVKAETLRALIREYRPTAAEMQPHGPRDCDNDPMLPPRLVPLNCDGAEIIRDNHEEG